MSFTNIIDSAFLHLIGSSQVGCRQACTFCATGKMGKLRSLTADEILVQVYYASKICRVVGNIRSGQNDDDGSSLPKVDNIGKKDVFSSCCMYNNLVANVSYTA